MRGPNANRFIGFGDIHGVKLYKNLQGLFTRARKPKHQQRRLPFLSLPPPTVAGIAGGLFLAIAGQLGTYPTPGRAWFSKFLFLENLAGLGVGYVPSCLSVADELFVGWGALDFATSPGPKPSSHQFIVVPIATLCCST